VTFIALVSLALSLTALALGAFTFVDALTRPTAAFPAAGKLTKPVWVAITGVAALVLVPFLPGLGLFSFFGIPALVASLVYLLDVRPAVRGVSGGRPPTSSW
jgi:Protein of unknown function (DUF2516)